MALFFGWGAGEHSSRGCISSDGCLYSAMVSLSFSLWPETEVHSARSRQRTGKLYFRNLIRAFVFSASKILLFGFSSNKATFKSWLLEWPGDATGLSQLCHPLGTTVTLRWHNCDKPVAQGRGIRACSGSSYRRMLATAFFRLAVPFHTSSRCRMYPLSLLLLLTDSSSA